METSHGLTLLDVIQAVSEVGENERGLKMAIERGEDDPHVGFLAAGDICRAMGRSQEALGHYQKVLDKTSTDKGDAKQAKERARASIEAIKLVDTLDLKRVPDGTYRDNSVGYSGQVFVEDSAVAELLGLLGQSSLDTSRFQVTPDLPRTDPRKFEALLNEKA